MQAKPLTIISAACLVCMDTSDRLSLLGLSAAVLTAILALLPSCLSPRRWRHKVSILCCLMFLLICLIDSYCQITLGAPISPQVLSTVLQTDGREAAEYLTTFVSPALLADWHIETLLLLTILLVIPLPARKIPPPALLCSLIVLIAIQLPSTFQCLRLFRQSNDTKMAENLIFHHHLAELSTPLHRLLFAAYSCMQTSRQLETMKTSTFCAKIDSCSYLSPHIVLVIGESYNKHHSSLYGYTLKTTPLQQQREKDGELIAFSNVVTPWNITSNVFIDLFSLWEYGMEASQPHLPMFPILFRRAGYEVNFTSNQYRLRGLRKGQTNQAGNFFLADRTMSDSLFTHRIPSGTAFDMEFLRQFVKNKKQWGQAAYTLDIIHLIGQHFNYAHRYPSQHTVFTPSDYTHRSLSHKEKQTVAHYDNATRYNDDVLDSLLTLYESEEAVVVFVADHGEEVYDETPVQGRLFHKPTAPIARQEYEIPMWIWSSESYRKKHPDVVRQIKAAKDKPFITDALPQLLLHLAGIKCRWTNQQRNLLLPQYKSKPRIIAGCVDYDSIANIR